MLRVDPSRLEFLLLLLLVDCGWCQFLVLTKLHLLCLDEVASLLLRWLRLSIKLLDLVLICGLVRRFLVLLDLEHVCRAVGVFRMLRLFQ